ncbi:hypothetical protein BJX61DRAFT_546405 [Aspergillus egyptiacus]|nr:hypothetical protein BJX61DRAFT_546405 [Aspergillus egyptiacus]
MPDLSPPHHRVNPGMPLAGDQEPNKLVLCFDGTGNTFSGSNADTNVVKILNKLDRHCPQQYHYYQNINEKSVNKTWLGEMRSSVSQTLDQAFGTTFDHHVMAGYRFLMRYYEPGDKIYMFGFSRGAFTAKFLARMIHTVGLLCRGNEEMVPFAFRLYQRYLAGEFEDFAHSHSTGRSHSSERRSDGDTDPILKTLNQQQHQHQHHGHTYESARNEVVAFSNTFCQQLPTSTGPDADGHIVYENIKVYFLGIWDCVNSVAVLERNAPMPVPVKGTAQFVRHAVAVDERRVKFKPALMAQDIRCASAEHSNQEDIKEVWFPGCHGDVGGGWPAGEGDHLDAEQSTSNTGSTPSCKAPLSLPTGYFTRTNSTTKEKDP